MSLITSTASKKLCFRMYPAIYMSVRNHWNKDYKPGPFPETKPECEAAAKKYNLLPEDYKPIANDGFGAGDYPDLPLISGDAKDPFYPWDNPELKRNYGEPIHEQQDLISEDRYDISAKHKYSIPSYFLQFFLWMGTMYGLMVFFEDKKGFAGVAAKQLPGPGIKHYTFEARK